MAARDAEFLILGIAGDADNLHAIHERARHVVGVSGGNEHDVRQIVVDFKIVIVEIAVLLGIEHLEQCRCRIAARVVAHFVDLVEQQQRVGEFGLLHRLDNLARHRADIGAAMAADFGFITHAAQRHLDVMAARGARNRAGERGFADAGRAYQAENGAFELARALLHGEIFEDALFDFLEPVMILVENLLRMIDVTQHTARPFPRNRHHPVEIIADDRRLRRH